MIKEFVAVWEKNKGKVEAAFKVKEPGSYENIVREVIKAVHPNEDYDDNYGLPDPNRIHSIDDGDYQGTLLFMIAAIGYQPSDYWYVKVSYGSCGALDTLHDIQGYGDEPPTEEQIKDYMTLALHILQGLKKLDDDKV